MKTVVTTTQFSRVIRALEVILTESYPVKGYRFRLSKTNPRYATLWHYWLNSAGKVRRFTWTMIQHYDRYRSKSDRYSICDYDLDTAIQALEEYMLTGDIEKFHVFLVDRAKRIYGDTADNWFVIYAPLNACPGNAIGTFLNDCSCYAWECVDDPFAWLLAHVALFEGVPYGVQ